MTTRTDFTQPQAGLLGEARTMKMLRPRVTLAAADLVTGNIVEAFRGAGRLYRHRHSRGCVRHGLRRCADPERWRCGSGTRFLNASTIGQAGATTSTLATTGVLFAYTADTKILVTCTLQGSSSVAGTLDLYLQGFVAG
jgi:hypothetical protein